MKELLLTLVLLGITGCAAYQLEVKPKPIVVPHDICLDKFFHCKREHKRSFLACKKNLKRLSLIHI